MPKPGITFSKEEGQNQEQQPWYKRLNPLRWGPMPPVPPERIECPEQTASFFSKITFQWMTPIMAVGYRRPLELNDVWLVNPDRRIDLLADRFNASFTKRVKRGDKHPLAFALHDTFKKEFWIGGFCLLFASLCQVMVPFTLRFLISFVTDAYEAKKIEDATHTPGTPGGNSTPGPSIGHGFALVFGIMVMQMTQSLLTNNFIYLGFITGGQARGVLITSIFEKTMKLSGRARAGGSPEKLEDETPPEPQPTLEEKQNFAKRFFKGKQNSTGGVKMSKKANTESDEGWENGRVTAMMSTDSARIDQAFGMFHLLWTSPITIFLTLTILIVNLTYSALAGFSLLFLGIPALTLAIKSLITRRRSINEISDQRVSLTQEILRSVRFVKYYAWENALLQQLRSIRKREITMIQKLLTTRNGINAASVSLPIFASMMSFIVYSVTNHSLTPDRIFSSLSLFNALRVPFNLLPVVIGQVTDAWSSMNRIQQFLLAEEQQDDIVWDDQAEYGITVDHADFVWEKTAGKDSEHVDDTASEITAYSSPEQNAKGQDQPFSLHDIHMSIRRNELLAVIGTVGSGKSSLLSALAGEMRKTKGQITMGATRALCPQYAWIQNATLKDNILFGKDMDRQWYEQVVYACALQPDLEMLPEGEETEIGERGINVSGGQKQRLNIARAIYSNSDIILMDDPLSAVDAHVGRHMFDKAICGLLANKCRILATHQLHVLSQCDRILWLDDGNVKALDTFSGLYNNYPEFRDMLASTAQEDRQDEKEEVEEAPQPSVPTAAAPKPNLEEPRAGALMQEEEKAGGSVSWSVYTSYVRASGSLLYGIVPMVLLVVAQGANTLTSLWLSYWTSNKFGFSRNKYIGIYIALGFVQAFLMFVFSASLSILGTRSSRTMLDRAISRVLKAPMAFFDTTPLGRITNRFAKDVDTMDNNLTDAIRMYLYTIALITSVFILLIIYFHYFGIALGPLLLVFLFAAAYYRASAREMKRHEAVLRSVMFARFGEAITGTATIRAYNMQDHFGMVLRKAIDNMNSAYYLTFSNQRWLSTRLDVVANGLVITTGILVITLRYQVDPSISGLVLSYILSIVQMIQLLVRQLAEVENAMNSAERLHHYGTQVEQEKTLENAPPVPRTWPEKGDINFENASLRYRAGLPLVLRGLDMRISGGERIGIVGRTGSGKSTTTSALFRLVELASGSITIDGLDISKISLQDLRSRLAIIPQDPTLFKGTVRSNLDPFNEHEDLALWSALRQAGLVHTSLTSAADGSNTNSTSRITLETVVEEEGLNFSLGQRQLMALARALVRDSRIIICDEATSSVDMETDRRIQQAIMTAFKGKTLLCIAHRLRTIIRYDRICVMDAGKIAELGPPLALWENKDGIFRSMCERSGIGRNDFDEDQFRVELPRVVGHGVEFRVGAFLFVGGNGL
ncbi:P-loop containing nucleoside triphosphate hydrolase protein [Saccharata proteae CBS 121410]|uniref:P-loop containing nucleoside triphosphate hydrolase protein n=1 Tax=Saccharata proteae CBS 121410 TaxID=1314787 RepID=A0A6A5YBN7_9PEZI|nr:P-loop containing nucleoside triphosphate hydrolase protein [Saccharata proteae CBS 121410]